MATSDTTKSITLSGLPRRLTLLIIQIAGIALMVVGFQALVYGDVFLGKPFGLVVVLTGVDLLLRPGARRRPPQVDQLLLKLLERRRPPPLA
jgi:hypothetical protein